MKRLVLFLSSILIWSLIPAISASPPTPGSSCAKQGISTTSMGKRYTCIKSGKNLIWNKGVVIKSVAPQPKPVASATPIPSASPSRSSSPEESPSTKPTVPTSTSGSVSENNCGEKAQIFTTGIERINNSDARWLIRVVNVCSYRIDLDSPSGKKWSTGVVNTNSANNQEITGKFSNLNCFPTYQLKVTVWNERDGKGNSIVNPPLGQLERFCQPDPSATAIEGGDCFKVGDRVMGSASYLECRWVKGRELIWIKLSNIPQSFINPTSAQPVDVCKLKGDFEIANNAIVGFGHNFSSREIPPIGINRSLIVPIDFPDIPGEANFLDRMLDQRQKMIDWVKYYSTGKLDFQVDYLDSWVRTPLPSAEYDLYKYQGTFDKRTPEGNEITRVYAQKYVDLITRKVNLQNYQTIYIFYPAAQKTMRDFVPRVQRYQVKEGVAVLSVFAIGDYDTRMGTPYFSFWIHETGHDWGLKGHSPGDGWPVGIMVNQAGFELSLSGWEQFLLSWLPDNQVYCETKETLKPAEIKLSPLEREDKQTKIIAIALDASRLLVVESHGIEKWSSRRLDSPIYYNFDSYGFYGVMAYIVNTKAQGALVRDAAGATLSTDDGNNDSVPRQAKFYPIEGEASNFYGLNKFDSAGLKTNDAYIAVQGDHFIIEGIKISFEKADDYNTVRIEKA